MQNNIQTIQKMVKSGQRIIEKKIYTTYVNYSSCSDNEYQIFYRKNPSTKGEGFETKRRLHVANLAKEKGGVPEALPR